jgi:N6-L-threonylcarbamoyladenine synthase
VGFPRATFEGQGYDFSFSGVKTAALTDWEARLNGSLPKVELCDWIASFETAVMDALCVQLFRAAEETNVSVVGLAGGVACNRRLRRMVGQWAQRTGRRAILPEASLCADNAAMIAAVGLYHWQPANVCRYDFDAIPNWGLGTPLPD